MTTCCQPKCFLLSRLDRPMVLRDLLAISGASEEETLGSRLRARARWLAQTRTVEKCVSRSTTIVRRRSLKRSHTATRERTEDRSKRSTRTFLERVKNAQTHYDVLSVNWDVSAQDLKNGVLPVGASLSSDRFRKAERFGWCLDLEVSVRTNHAGLRHVARRQSSCQLQLEARSPKKSRTVS